MYLFQWNWVHMIRPPWFILKHILMHRLDEHRVHEASVHLSESISFFASGARFCGISPAKERNVPVGWHHEVVTERVLMASSD